MSKRDKKKSWILSWAAPRTHCFEEREGDRPTSPLEKKREGSNTESNQGLH